MNSLKKYSKLRKILEFEEDYSDFLNIILEFRIFPKMPIEKGE
jgi:hypothetical protein